MLKSPITHTLLVCVLSCVFAAYQIFVSKSLNIFVILLCVVSAIAYKSMRDNEITSYKRLKELLLAA